MHAERNEREERTEQAMSAWTWGCYLAAVAIIAFVIVFGITH